MPNWLELISAKHSWLMQEVTWLSSRVSMRFSSALSRGVPVLVCVSYDSDIMDHVCIISPRICTHTTFYYELKTPQRVSQKWFQSHSCTFSIPISLTALSTMFFTSSSTWWSCSSKRSPSVVFSSITKLTYKDRMRESSITHNMFFFLYHSADICIIVFSFFLNSR